MTRQGKFNLLGILVLPAAAVLGAFVATLNGVWNAYGATYLFLFGLNFGFMLLVGLLSGLLLLWSRGERARWWAIVPTWVTAAWGGLWYLWRAVFPAEVAPGAEYIGAPQYLLVGALVAVVVVILLRVTGIVPRTA